jgi:hypothetical protein
LHRNYACSSKNSVLEILLKLQPKLPNYYLNVLGCHINLLHFVSALCISGDDRFPMQPEGSSFDSENGDDSIPMQSFDTDKCPYVESD